MDTERPHRTTSSNSSSTSELFVCFTSRLSSSSMKLSSKSILSPSRSRDPPQISLSTSLSRRLRSNGSMKGGQASPMFPTGGKRRGCGFENPEPSSPKVTCIGQVRVKTKKQGKKMRARSSKRRSEATSFRKTEQGFQVGSNIPDLTRQNSQSYQFHNHQNLQQECLKHRNNQRWVHLPLTICEALREFNCFFPCRSSCMSGEREKEEKGEREGSSGREGSCGSAFARWLVTLQEGDAKGRGIELVMGNDENCDDDDDDDDDAGRSRRRHVFEDIDIDVVEGKKHEDEEEEKGRVSICIPPKNALLLMRCRSDPVKMAALANKFWESPVHKEHYDEQDEGNRDEEEEEEEQQKVEAVVEEEAAEVEVCGEEQHIVMEEDEEMQAKTEKDSICEKEREAISVHIEEDHVLSYPDTEEEEAEPQVQESYEIESRTNPENNEEVIVEANQVTEEQEEKEGNANDQSETFSSVSSPEVHLDLEKPELQELYFEVEDNVPMENEKDESSELSPSPEPLTVSEQQNDEAEDENAEETMAETSTEDPQLEQTSHTPPNLLEQEQNQEPDPTQIEPDPNPNPGSNDSPKESKVEEREREELPECLLLMMCEPKLSMEVSKETWVCSTDFIRWLPERPAAAAASKRASLDSKLNNKPPPPSQPPMLQPARSSCSFPAAPTAGMSMATMIEQKLLGSKSNNYEPFVLTRCKSEPMRSSAMAKLAAENCFWKNRKLQPHPPPAIGAPAGVGF